MAKSLAIASYIVGTPYTQNATFYAPLAGTLQEGELTTTEADAQIPVRDAGVFANLYTRVITNTVAATSTVTFRKSLADTSIVVTYTSTQTGVKEDTANTSTFAATDEASYKLVIGNDTGAVTFTIIQIQFEPTTSSNTISFFVNNGYQRGLSGASATHYRQPMGLIINNQTTETNQKYDVQHACTASNFYVYIGVNPRTTNTTFRTRKNGANGGQSVVFAGAETGAKEDASNTDTLAVADDFNFSSTTGTGTESMGTSVMSVRLVNTANLFALNMGRTAGLTIAFNTTLYYPISGELITGTSTESRTQTVVQKNLTLSKLGCFVSANTIATSASVITVRDNGADSSLTLSYAAAETGQKTDSSNTAVITALTDEMNLKIVTPNTSGNFTPRYIGVIGKFDVTTLQTQAGKARIQKATTQTQLGKAAIRKTTTQTQAGKARVQKSVTQTIQGKASIEAGNDTNTQTIDGKARVQKSVAQTQAGKARITAAATRTQTGKARIQKAATQNQTGLARIQKSVTATTTGKARITASTTQTQLGKARIQKSATQDQQGKARIQASSTATITGKARIQAFVLQLITGKSRIQAVVGQTIQGRSRIQKAAQGLITGIARITAAGVRTITGRARITATEDQTIQGLGRVTAQSDETISGRARITKVVAALIQGVARIMKSALQTIQGKARIKVSVQEDIDGQSRIQKRVTQTISGRAQIKSAHIYPYSPKVTPPYSPKVSPFTSKASPFTPKTGPYTPKESPYRKFQD